MIRMNENQVLPARLTTRPSDQFKVLVVDDDARIVEVLSTILARDGYQVFMATDGEEAWSILDQEHPDLSVMDVLLPRIDGIELCRRIKQNPATRLSMVILMTGFSERSRRLDGLHAGADDFLKKPIDPFELTVRVRTLLRTKELYDEIEANRKDLEERVAERTRELKTANTRLEELNRVKSNILGIVSHELRTPLVMVKGGLGLAMHDDIDPQERERLLRGVEKSLGMLEYRVEDVDIFSDPPDLTITSVSVSDLVASAVSQVEILQPHSRDRVQMRPLAGLPLVQVDPSALSRVLAHIIDNGLKFSGENPVTVAVEVVHGDVVIAVEDRGIGIPEDDRERVFLPLEQGDDSATRPYNGLGMGLALAKTILDAHQIEFTITTEEGMGTTVTLTLPAARC
jgi:hypothetical protein